MDDDKEIGHRAIANSEIFEEHLGLTAAPFDAKKASGLRFYKAGHPIKGHQDAWPGYIEEQLGWALEMKKNNRGDRSSKNARQQMPGVFIDGIRRWPFRSGCAARFLRGP